MGLYADCLDMPRRFVATLTLPDGREITGEVTTKPTTVSLPLGPYLIPALDVLWETPLSGISARLLNSWLNSPVRMVADEQSIRLVLIGATIDQIEGQMMLTSLSFHSDNYESLVARH